MRRGRRRKFKRLNFKLSHRVIWIGSFFIAGAAALGVLGYAVYTCGVFKIKEENIQSNVVLSKDLKEKIKIGPLFNLNTREISSCILKAHPEYKEVIVSKKFPSSVVIEVKKRIPFAQIKANRFYCIDREAVILDSGDSKPFPEFIPIEFEDHSLIFKRGSAVRDERLEYAFNLIEVLRDERFLDRFGIDLINSVNLKALYFSGWAKEPGAKNDSPDGNIRVIIGDSDFEQKIKLLKGLMGGELKGKSDLVKYIDLRYKKVYIGFKR